MIKVLTLVGTRPELIKLSRVINILDKYTNHILVHTGQNYDYELNEIFFKQLEIRKPDHFLNAAGKNAADTIANVIKAADEIIELEKPNAFLVYGDTNSCLSVIAAKRKKVPVFHMEAGNRCFDQRVPEEINRKIVDHISDINLVISEHARSYLIKEGISQETIIKTGSSMKEVLDYHAESINKCDILEREKLNINNYIIVSIHREENVDDNEHFNSLLDSLNGISKRFDKRIIVSTHPRTRKRLEGKKISKENKKIEFMKPFGFFEYIKLQQNAFCVVSDSGSITEEASILKFPAVTVRQAHERPEGMDEGTIIMTGLKKDNIINAIEVSTALFNDPEIDITTVEDYKAENVSQKVLKIILSYTGYVNRTIWRKNEL